jgi:hypothetical protein
MGTVGGNLASGPLTDLWRKYLSRWMASEDFGTTAPDDPCEELFLDFYTTSLAEDEILAQVVLPPSRRARASSTSASPAARWSTNRLRVSQCG